jgi:hypothetical protein
MSSIPDLAGFVATETIGTGLAAIVERAGRGQDGHGGRREKSRCPRFVERARGEGSQVISNAGRDRAMSMFSTSYSRPPGV